MSGYDIIGDIHGQSEKLETLLTRLGYVNGRHADGRKALFLGDLINRGPSSRQVVHRVRSMQEDGNASVLMGNHEFNAVCYATESKRGGYVRPHTPAFTAGLAGFLTEFPMGSEEYKSTVKWFKTLPLYFQGEGFRAVHACWHQGSIDLCQPFLKDKQPILKSSAYAVYDSPKNPLNAALEVILRGPEYTLPEGVTFKDSSGANRKKPRLYWWEHWDSPLRAQFEKAEQVHEKLRARDKAKVLTLRDKFNYESEMPVFFGHYHLVRQPGITSEKAACLNFKDAIVAYRWNQGDTRLNAANLVCV